MNRYIISRYSDFPLKDDQLLILEPAGQEELDPEVFFSFNNKLSSKGYSLLYIPYIVNAMSIDTIKYYVPGYKGNQSAEEIQSRVAAALELEVKAPLALIKKGYKLSAIDSEAPESTTVDFLSSLIETLPQIKAAAVVSRDVETSEEGIMFDYQCSESLFDDKVIFDREHIRKSTEDDCNYSLHLVNHCIESSKNEGGINAIINFMLGKKSLTCMNSG